MFKTGFLFCCSLLFLLPLVGQKISLPELQKIKILDKKKRQEFLLSRKYEKGDIRTDGDNEAVVYKNITEQGGKMIIRNVSVITSTQIKLTILEYTTYDLAESAAMISWLTQHGYRKSTDTVNGQVMFFSQSNSTGIRFSEEKGKLSDGTDFNSATFILDY